ncbi:YrhK family protein [Brevibacterium sp. RIT803]|nr:YrhK family protein [Brevibacterium sp. RIT 803]
MSIVNDVLIGIWFLVLGSVEMLIRPVIRLIRHVHLQKIRGPQAPTTDATYDF